MTNKIAASQSHVEATSKIRQSMAGYEFAAVIIVAMIVRGVAGWLSGESLAADNDSYARLAVNLAQSGTLGIESESGQVTATAFRPPLYPMLLSMLVLGGKLNLFGVACLHFLLGTATVGFIYAIARRLKLTASWLPAVCVAVDPLLLRASQLVMTETLAALLVVVVWWLWLVLMSSGQNGDAEESTGNRDWFSGVLVLGLGLVLGLAILARPTAAPWAACCLLGIVACKANRSLRQRCIHAVLCCAGIAALVLPWTVRNYYWLGKPVWATTHGGYTLLLANNPLIYEHFENNGPSRNWDAQRFHVAWGARESAALSPVEREYWFMNHEPTTFPHVPELRDDRMAYDAALATIRRGPRQFALSCVYRLGWLWAVWPNDVAVSNDGDSNSEPSPALALESVGASTIEESFPKPNVASLGGDRFVRKLPAIAVGGWYFFWFLIAAYCVFCRLWSTNLSATRNRFAVWLPGLALVVTLSLVHSVYWANMRMRAPAMGAVYLMAASGLPTRRQSDS